MPSKNKAPIQLLKPLHNLTVLKPFYCQNQFAAQNRYPCKRHEVWWQLGIDYRRVAKPVETSEETVECMPMKLFEANDIAERMLHAYFTIWHEIRQAQICV